MTACIMGVAGVSGLSPASAQLTPCQALITAYNNTTDARLRAALLTVIQARGCTLPTTTTAAPTIPPTTPTVPPTTPTTVPASPCVAIAAALNVTTNPLLVAQLQAAKLLLGCN